MGRWHGDVLLRRDVRVEPLMGVKHCTRTKYCSFLVMSAIASSTISDSASASDELFYRSNGTTQAADDPTISTTLDLSISRVDGTFKLQRLAMNSLAPDHPMAIEDYTGHCEKQNVHTKF
jgi:hypothetical protein